MDRSTPKSYHSTAEKSKIICSTPSYFDRDIQMEKEYLQKLKTQRIKAQRLYAQYKSILSDRDKLKSINQHLEDQLNSFRSKYQTIAQESKTELIKIRCLNDRLESENKNLRNEQLQFFSFKHRYENSFKDMEKQMEMHYQQNEEYRQTIEHLEDDLRGAEAQNKRIRNQYEDQVRTLQGKIAQVQSNYQRVCRQTQSEKEMYMKNKSLWEQEREQISQTITLKTEQLKAIKTDFDCQINDKDRLYQIAVSQLQEGKIFWKVKIDEKNRQITTFKKTVQSLKEQTRKIKTESAKEKQRFKDTQQRQHKLKQSIEDLSAKLKSKDYDYCSLHEKYLKTMEETHNLSTRIQQLQNKLKACDQTNRRLNENCEEYLKIIEKMEKEQQRRLYMSESQYEEIDKMEVIFSEFQ